MVSEQATGYPGYDSIITKDTATIGTILKDNGYRTSWFGKNHNTPAFQAQPGSGRSTSGPSAWASSTSTASSAATPASGSRNLFRNTTAIYPYVGKPELEPDHRDGGRGHRLA